MCLTGSSQPRNLRENLEVQAIISMSVLTSVRICGPAVIDPYRCKKLQGLDFGFSSWQMRGLGGGRPLVTLVSWLGLGQTGVEIGDY